MIKLSQVGVKVLFAGWVILAVMSVASMVATFIVIKG
jgi:hypothetical protein